MVEKNPFCISFGKKPFEYIDRTLERQRIIDTFELEPITDQLFLITGIRGSGKTVLMNTVAEELSKNGNWIILRESASSNLLEMVYSDLYDKLNFKKQKIKKITLSLGAANLEMSSSQPKENIITKIDEQLIKAEKANKKILILIDEVVNTDQMKKFAHMFQIEIARNRQIFFLGTGLYENLLDLSDEKDLTFLHRSPRIVLSPLNLAAIARSYATIFSLNKKEAKEMALLTKGYSFAFQALGYICWNSNYYLKSRERHKDFLSAEILSEYDALLADASYSKIWSECSQKDKEILLAMMNIDTRKVAEIRKSCNMSINYFSVYRSRLIKKGILFSPTRGEVEFALPRFRNFLDNQFLE